jgi:hypothetical protein
MIKDDTRDQIPLFDLPVPDTGSTRPAAKEAKSVPAEKLKPAQVVRTKTEKVAAAPVPGPVTRQRKAASRAGRKVKTSPGPVPEGDVRLTANIREDLHLKLKIVAATRRTTIGELIEDLVEHHL